MQTKVNISETFSLVRRQRSGGLDRERDRQTQSYCDNDKQKERRPNKFATWEIITRHAVPIDIRGQRYALAYYYVLSVRPYSAGLKPWTESRKKFLNRTQRKTQFNIWKIKSRNKKFKHKISHNKKTTNVRIGLICRNWWTIKLINKSLYCHMWTHITIIWRRSWL